MTYVDYSKTKYCRRCDIRVDKSKFRCPWCNGALAYRPLVNRRLNGQKRTDKRKAVKVEGGNQDALGVVRDLDDARLSLVCGEVPAILVPAWTTIGKEIYLGTSRRGSSI